MSGSKVSLYRASILPDRECRLDQVAGALALYLERDPLASADQAIKATLESATRGVLKDSVGGATDSLLFIGPDSVEGLTHDAVSTAR
jgi:hypothetical protein